MNNKIETNGVVYNLTYKCDCSDIILKDLLNTFNIKFLLLRCDETSIYSNNILIYMPINSVKLFEIKYPKYSEYKFFDE
jgi:hypothetical protein